MSESDFLGERISAAEAAILALEGAYLSLAEHGVLSYKLDTGQGEQTVTRVDLPSIGRQLKTMMGYREILIASRAGGGATQIRPGF